MWIEIAKPERMSMTGSSLFDSIQNKHTPILDLLVRESIQNSLDAALPTVDSVNVNFRLGHFNPVDVNNLLDGVSEKLNRRYCHQNTYDYLAICDSHTVGLTGPLHTDDVKDGQSYGNLIKLVYEISKPQMQEGAGGSWGLGKTVYFRVGMGLVFYYSRIKNENGQYESRLAAALIEDERSSNAIIPSLKGVNIKRGIAWWGRLRKENSTCPITNEEEIAKILALFDIPPYQGDKTGTVVIIPYIDRKKLLLDNRPNLQDDGQTESFSTPSWYESVEEYLKIAVQRWYAPRLNNEKYQVPFLKVAINNVCLAKDEMEPLFAIYQDLYNIAKDPNVPTNDQLFEDIKIRTVLQSTDAGRVVFKILSRSDLKMTLPDNKPTPEMYCNLEVRISDGHKPIFAFTRKPGMMVAYKDVGPWLEGVPATDPDHFMVALFVLNSENTLKECNHISLEEYIRKSELADHTSWKDHLNQRIIAKIQAGVSKKLSNAVKAEQNQPVETKNSTFARILGDLLLPKLGFGTKPGLLGKSKLVPKKKKKGGGPVFSIDSAKTVYAESYMDVFAEWSSNAPLSKVSVSLAIESESGSIKAEEWENEMQLEMPFEIESVSLEFLKSTGLVSNKSLSVSKNKPQTSLAHCSLALKKTAKGAGYSISLQFDASTVFRASATIQLRLLDLKKDKRPTFLLGKEN